MSRTYRHSRGTRSPIGKGRWTLNGLQLADARGLPTIERARAIQRTLGTFNAARFLRARGWSLEAALVILTMGRRA